MTITGHIVELNEATETPSIEELHDRWSDASRTRLGLSRQQWHHPVAARVVTALGRGDDLGDLLGELGEARAQAGLSMKEALADLGVLSSLCPSAQLDTLIAAERVGAAWAQARYEESVVPQCVDTITGLATREFLEVRLEEMYRRCAHLNTTATTTYALVVLQINCTNPSPFACVARRLKGAAAMRLTFPLGDTAALLEPTDAMVVLTERNDDLATNVAALHESMPEDSVWVEDLPETSAQAVALIRELAAIPRVPLR